MGELFCPFCDSTHVRAVDSRGLFQCLAEDCQAYFEEEDPSERPTRRSKDDNEPTRWD